MSDFKIVMEAKHDLWFMNGRNKLKLFARQGELKCLPGIATVMLGATNSIRHDDKNFRFYVPLDMLGKREP